MKTWIIDKLIIKGKLVSKRCNKTWFIKNGFLKQYEEILILTSFLNDPPFSQRIWHIVNDHFFIKKCKNPSCDNSPTFFTFTKGYLETCSNVCAQKNPETINKIKSTNLKKYGVEYGLSNKKIIEKKKLTCLKNYGVDNPTKSKIVLDLISKNNSKKYGVDWILEDQEKKEKAVFQKYGVKNIQQSSVIKQKTQITRRSTFYDLLFTSDRLKDKVIPLFDKNEYVNNGYYKQYSFQCKKCNTIFLDCLEDGDIPRCNKCYKSSSIFEKDIFNFIKIIYNDEIIENSKKILSSGLELDIYLPKLKLAIECDGLYWHGEIGGNKDKNYHLNKTLDCEKLGIKLIHIFEDEWITKKEIVKSKLSHLLVKNHNKKIYARDCVIKNVSFNDKKDFLNKYHIQGNDNSNIYFGLYYDHSLVSIMSFNKPRIFIKSNEKNDNNTFELVRFASSDVVIGGASKLLSHFIKTHKPSKIISYADRRWSSGNLYEKIGFKKVSDGTPNYWYFGKEENYKRHHRFGFAKHTLKSKLETFAFNLSEWQNMKNNGWDRIWDCGNLKYELIIP